MKTPLRAALALTSGLGLGLIGCQANDADSMATRNPASTESPGGMEGDRARIRQSLSTMDDGDRDVAMSKMQGLIDHGLYDPENENPLKVGEQAPDFELMPLRFYDFAIEDGITKENAGSLFEPVRLSSFKGSIPVVLIFGSYTWPPFKDQAGSLDALAKKYESKAQFLVVYIKEAHPSDDWASRVNPRLTYIKDPTTFYERSQVANTCMSDLDIDIPCLIDDMDNTAARAYKGWPDRLFVVSKDGDMAYVGKPGPFGFLPSEMEAALQEELKK